MENMSEFGEIFAAGRIVNLDKSSISDLQRYLGDVQKNKEIAKSRLTEMIDEIRSI